MVETVNKEEVQELMKDENVVILNVLKAEQYEDMHIAGSGNIALDELQEDAWKVLDKSKKYVVYCYDADCQASSKAASFMDEKGFEVVDYEAGMVDWARSGLPVEGNLSREEYLG